MLKRKFTYFKRKLDDISRFLTYDNPNNKSKPKYHRVKNRQVYVYNESLHTSTVKLDDNSQFRTYYNNIKTNSNAISTIIIHYYYNLQHFATSKKSKLKSRSHRFKNRQVMLKRKFTHFTSRPDENSRYYISPLPGKFYYTKTTSK